MARALAVALLAPLLAALAPAAEAVVKRKPPSIFDSPLLWATVNVCDTKNSPDTIGMDAEARRRHLYVVGSTGAGKSTLLLNLIHQDMLGLNHAHIHTVRLQFIWLFTVSRSGRIRHLRGS